MREGNTSYETVTQTYKHVKQDESFSEHMQVAYGSAMTVVRRSHSRSAYVMAARGSLGI